MALTAVPTLATEHLGLAALWELGGRGAKNGKSWTKRRVIGSDSTYIEILQVILQDLNVGMCS